jgi:sugar/nucleoside kinase (ribokinase family)
MKFLLIGHFSFDVHHPHNGTELVRYGGIYHALVTMASIMEKGDTAFPVFGLGKSDYDEVLDKLSGLPNISTEGIFKLQGPTNRVHFYTSSGHQPVECSKDIAPPIPYEKIRRHLSVNGILVNMVSGTDITLETLDHIRMAIRSHNITLHFDYHNLTLGIGEEQRRYRRPIDEWRRWAFMTDTVQLNEEEIAGLSPDQMSEEQTASHLLTLGIKGVVLTRGAAGASVFVSEHKRVLRTDIPGIHVNGGKADSTGCGDVFGAAFHYQYTKTSDMHGSAEFANRIAASQMGSATGGSASIGADRRLP